MPAEREKDNEIRRLKIDNELLRDFLRLAGRRQKHRLVKKIPRLQNGTGGNGGEYSEDCREACCEPVRVQAVSYTHLDVYKRQTKSAVS